MLIQQVFVNLLEKYVNKTTKKILIYNYLIVFVVYKSIVF
jgi:hypothetical protein